MSLLCLLAAGLLTGQVLTTDGNPVKGVVVSDGITSTVTNGKGLYKMKSEMPLGYVFISVPSGYDVPADGFVPRFFSRERQNARFEIIPADQSEYNIMMLADLHLTGDKVDDDLHQFHAQYFPPLCRAVEELKAKGKIYTFCLGDMCTNGKWYKNHFCYPEFLKEMEGYPTPLWNIMGNHDNDEKCSGTPKEWESLAEQKYIAAFGPKYYSLKIGGIHYLMLDDIITNGPKTKDNPATNFVGKYSYTYAIDPVQMAWIAEDLKHVPKTTPLVVCLHCPLYQDGKKRVANAEEFISLLQGRKDIHIFAGHIHTNRVSRIAPEITEHILSSGSATSWKLNDLDAPIVCKDGTPGGWQILTVKDKSLSWQFQSMYESAQDSQISVHDLGDGYVLVDIFNWDPSWTVSASCGGKAVALEQIWSQNPVYDRIRRETKMLLKRPTFSLGQSAPHYFRGYIPGDPSEFVVTATDGFGHTYRAGWLQTPYPQWGMAPVTVFEKGERGYDTFRIPAIVRTREGELLAFAEARKDGAGDTGNIDLVLKRSSDEGATWSPLEVVWDDADNVCGNPSPVVDRATGAIVMAMTWNDGRDKESAIHARTSISTRKVYCTRSLDDGHSWSAPQDITAQTKRPEWTWYATGPCHAVQLQNGRIVVPCNHGVYGSEGPAGTVSHVIYSDDLGLSWQIGGICPVGNEATAAALPDGSIIINMRRGRGTRPEEPYRLVAESRDGGLSFSEPRFDHFLPCPRCQGSLIGREGALYFSNPQSFKRRSSMTVKCSRDNGRNWHTVAMLPGAKAAYSDLVDLPGEEMGCLYEAGVASPYEKIVFARFRTE